jgi:hypothetical protein
MPCYRCGARQADPEAGKSSPWKRGVLSEHQVLICPDCQPGALSDLDRCARCERTHLIRRLDQVECLDCGLTREIDAADVVDASAPAAPGAPSSPALADQVARALDRVLGRSPAR